MIIYIIVFILIAICILLFDFNHRGISKLRNICFYTICFLLVIIGGFRYRIGIDSMRYMDSFMNMPVGLEQVRLIKWSISTQPLWSLFNILCKYIYNDFVIVQLLHSLILNVLIFRFIKKTTKFLFISVLAYYCFCWWNFNFEVLRESLCVAVFLNLYIDFLKNRKRGLFILFSIPLLFIHWFSIIIILLVLFISIIPINRLVYLLSSMLVILYVFSSITNIQSLIGNLDLLMDQSMSTRIELYLNSDSDGFILMSFIGFLFLFFSKVLFPLFLIKYGNFSELSKKMLLLYAFIILVRVKLLIAGRFINYLDLILIVSCVNFLFDNHIKCRYYKLSIPYKYVLFCFILMFYEKINEFYTPSSLETRSEITYDCRYIPYSSYLDKQKNSDRELLYIGNY